MEAGGVEPIWPIENTQVTDFGIPLILLTPPFPSTFAQFCPIAPSRTTSPTRQARRREHVLGAPPSLLSRRVRPGEQTRPADPRPLRLGAFVEVAPMITWPLRTTSGVWVWMPPSLATLQKLCHDWVAATP